MESVGRAGVERRNDVRKIRPRHRLPSIGDEVQADHNEFGGGGDKPAWCTKWNKEPQRGTCNDENHEHRTIHEDVAEKWEGEEQEEEERNHG